MSWALLTLPNFPAHSPKRRDFQGQDTHVGRCRPCIWQLLQAAWLWCGNVTQLLLQGSPQRCSDMKDLISHALRHSPTQRASYPLKQLHLICPQGYVQRANRYLRPTGPPWRILENHQDPIFISPLWTACVKHRNSHQGSRSLTKS